MSVGMYFNVILLVISATIVLRLAEHKSVEFPVMLYWCVQVVRYFFEILR